VKILEQTYEINAPIEKVWEALVNPDQITAWGAGPAKMTDKEGEMFSLWGGDVFGKNVQVEKRQKLVQDWYEGNWPKPSKVTFTLVGREDKTTIHLLHENVPDDEAKDLEKGWNDYYLGKIKKYLEE